MSGATTKFLAACAVFFTCVAAAQADDRRGEFDRGADYSVTLIGGADTVSVYRGQKSRTLNPSPFAVLEISYENWLGGMFATPSKIAGETRPLVVGYMQYTMPVKTFDAHAGARYYAFPDSSDFQFDIDGDGLVDKAGRKGFFEADIGLRKQFRSGRIEARAFYSPNFFGETGDAVYLYASMRRFLYKGFELRGHVGVSEFANDIYNDDYWDAGVGVYKHAFGLDMFVRYTNAFDYDFGDERAVVFGFEKAFTVASSDRVRSRRFEKISNDLVYDKALFQPAGYRQ